MNPFSPSAPTPVSALPIFGIAHPFAPQPHRRQGWLLTVKPFYIIRQLVPCQPDRSTLNRVGVRRSASTTAANCITGFLKRGQHDTGGGAGGSEQVSGVSRRVRVAGFKYGVKWLMLCVLGHLRKIIGLGRGGGQASIDRVCRDRVKVLQIAAV